MSYSRLGEMQPKVLSFLVLSYVVVLLLANWFDMRLISLGFGLATDAGTLIFPLTFLLSDLITEVYGYKKARRAIWLGFLFNLIFILYGQLVVHLPSPNYAPLNEPFDQLFSFNILIICASFVSYLVAEPFNALFLAKLKIWFDGRLIALRFVLSTMLAAALDTSIFSMIAFSSMMDTRQLSLFIITMWVIKVAIEILGLPLSVYLAYKLKKYECLDIYDTKTKFNLFSLNIDYQQEDNHFKNV
ncbi:queuosine precursor transporter [Thiotrichales bacterium 19S3-7]|nr:queuosine precursor transporter [Thiotrichales bacterium 19S3-7]MCF6801739.1 queuosine precursor transporter [Thiotrichales bacterium 19S3-11]